MEEQEFQEKMAYARELHIINPEQEEQFLSSFQKDSLSQAQRIEFNIELAYAKLTQSRANEALILYQEMYKKANRFGKQEFIADCLEGIGNCQVDQGNLSEAENNLKNAIAIYSLCKLPEKKSKACNTLAVMYYMKGEYDNALPYFDRSIELAEDKSSVRYVAAKGNSGLIYHSRGEMLKAAHLYQTAIRISEKMHYTMPIIVFRENLGDVMRELGRFAEAQENFEKALELAKHHGDHKHLATLNTSYAYYWIERGKFEKAYTYLQSSQTILEKIHYAFGLVNLYYVSAKYWLAKGLFQRAIEALEQSLEYMEKSGVKESRCSCLTLFAEIYEARGQTHQAYECLMEADLFAQECDAPVEHGGVLIERAKINLNQQNIYEAIMHLQEAKVIGERSGDFELQYKSSLLNAQAYLMLFRDQPKQEKYYAQALVYIEVAIQQVKEKQLIPKYLQALSIQGLLLILNREYEESKGVFAKAHDLAKEFNLQNHIQRNKERLAFVLQKSSSNPHSHSFNRFILDLAVEDLHRITSSFIQYNLTEKDIADAFFVSYKLDEKQGIVVHSTDNTAWDLTRDTADELLHMGTIYNIMFGQKDQNHQGIHGPFPFGKHNLRAVIYIQLIDSKNPSHPNSLDEAYLILCIVFPEKMSPLFFDKTKLTPIFGEHFNSITDLSQISDDFLANFRQKFFRILLDQLQISINTLNDSQNR